MNLVDKINYGMRVIKKSGPPIQLTYFITSRCNLRCEHCFYWKELDSDHSHELKLEEIEKIAQSLPRLLVLSLTGGEPFVRKDIEEIYNIFAKETRTHLITISTNGFYQKRMGEIIPKILESHPNTNLMIYLSIDGPEEIHDEIRGKGSYQAAIKSLEMMQPLRKQFKNFGVSVSMTCNRMNEDYLPDVFKELESSGKVDQVNIGFVRGNPKNPATKRVTVEKYRKLTNLKLESLKNNSLKYPNLFMNRFVSGKDYYTYKTVEDIYVNDHYVLPCQSGSLMGILYDDGNVYPCEILEDSCIGNVRDFNYNLPKLWAAHLGEKMRTQIRDGCYCTFECAMSSNILFNPKYIAKIAAKQIIPPTTKLNLEK